MIGASLARRELTGGLIGAWACALTPGVASALTTFNAQQQPLSPSANLPAWADADETILAGRSDRYARLTAPVFINNAGPFQFVVDTGANRSVISAELAQSLELPAGKAILVNTVASVASAPSVLVERVDVGGQTARRVAMATMPRNAIGGDGLLGIDQLDDRRLRLDFKGRRLTIRNSGPRPGDGDTVVVKAEQKSGRLSLVNAKVGNVPVVAFLDSGAEVSIGNRALRDALGLNLKPLEDVDVPVLAASGALTKGQFGVLPLFRLGGLRISNLRVVFAELHTFQLWNLQDQPTILLGVDLLRQFESVDLDFGRSRVLFRVEGWAQPATGSRLPAG